MNRRHDIGIIAAAIAGVFAIGVIDYRTGIEYRVVPLYFIPLGLAAWYLGRIGATIIAILAAFTWALSNHLAGMHFSSSRVWVANFATQALAFGFVGVLFSTMKRALERERRLSHTDPLTGLANSRAFYQQVTLILALARRHHRPLTLAYIDLDDFKRVNDSLGHPAGDDALRRAAEALRAGIRKGDFAARLGGDEFALLLPETGAEGAALVLERVRKSLAETSAASRMPLTCTIGAVAFRMPPDDVETLVKTADARMFDAKRDGKNRVRLESVE